jgi:membrane-anchored protein YejM (alkaline phosphatase superfamily)
MWDLFRLLTGDIDEFLTHDVRMAVPGILFVGLVVSTWKCAKRHRLRKIRRRWQNAYLMVNAHLATKKLRAEAEV